MAGSFFAKGTGTSAQPPAAIPAPQDTIAVQSVDDLIRNYEVTIHLKFAVEALRAKADREIFKYFEKDTLEERATASFSHDIYGLSVTVFANGSLFMTASYDGRKNTQKFPTDISQKADLALYPAGGGKPVPAPFISGSSMASLENYEEKLKINKKDPTAYNNIKVKLKAKKAA